MRGATVAPAATLTLTTRDLSPIPHAHALGRTIHGEDIHVYRQRERMSDAAYSTYLACDGIMFVIYACSDVGYEKLTLDGPCVPINGQIPTAESCTEGGTYQVPSGYVFLPSKPH